MCTRCQPACKMPIYSTLNCTSDTYWSHVRLYSMYSRGSAKTWIAPCSSSSLSLSLPWMKNGSPQLLEKRATGRDYFNGVFLIQKCPNRVDNLFQFWPDPIVREIQFFRKFEHHIIFNLFLGIHIIQIKKFIYLSKNNHGKYGWFYRQNNFQFYFQIHFLNWFAKNPVGGCVYVYVYVTLPWLDCEIIQWRAGPI